MPTSSQTVSPDRPYFRAASRPSIYSLPAKVLIEIACYAMIDDNTNRFRLPVVCRWWKAIINSAPRLWATLVLHSCTGRDIVSVWLGRSDNEPLRVIIDAGQKPHGSSETPFEGLQLAFKDIRRWKELIIISFPTDEALTSCNVRLCQPVEPLVRLEVIEIFPSCEQSTAIMTFLDSLTMSSLTRVHIFSSSVMNHLLDRHQYISIFFQLVHLHIDGRQLNGPVDILPLFYCLQSLTAYYLPLPEYDAYVSLPFIWRLRRLHLEGVSVQWMVAGHSICCNIVVYLHPENSRDSRITRYT
jgi:hypothetical protein